MNTRNFAKHLVILTVLGVLAACGGGGSTPASPVTVAAITAQPTDQSVVAGTAATFDVVASNASGYQWQSSTDGGTSFTNVSAATNASHTTAASTLPDSGTKYRVVVTGAGNSVTSSAATLTVTAAVVAPSISVQPAAQTTTAGQNASFSVTASGTSLSYQWQRSIDSGVSFADMAGESNATLTLTAVALADNAQQFRVVVSNSAGSVTSSAVTLTVNAAPIAAAFTLHPSNQSVTAPAVATFTAAAVGTPTPTLQWQVNATGSFADIAGATASSYTTAATVAGDNGNQYRVIATNAAGATTSNVATLTVTVPSAPSFTTHPANVTITEGQNAQFTVAVSGTPTPTLQWQLSTDNGANWSNINGETGTIFNVIGAALANNGRQFRAVATNGSGSVNSNAAVLTVNAAAPMARIIFGRDNGTVNAPNVDLYVIKEDGSGEIQLTSSPDTEFFRALAPGGRVVYQRITGVQGDLYSVMTDGTGTVALAATADFNTFAGITPSGRVIYRRDTVAGGRDLYAVNADGTNPTPLATTAANEDFAAITLNDHVIYSQNSNLHLVDVNGGVSVVFAINASLFRVTPAGDILFNSVNNISGIDELYLNQAVIATNSGPFRFDFADITATGNVIINRQPAGGGQRDLYINGSSIALANSADYETYVGSTASGRVIYQRYVPAGGSFQTDLYAVNSDGGNTNSLASTTDNENFAGITPDGRVIYRRDTATGGDLYAVNADGTGTVALANSAAFHEEFKGITTSGRVIYERTDGTTTYLYAVNIDGTGTTPLVNSGGNAFFVATTPSGKVLFSRQSGNADLYIVNADGTGLSPLANTGNNEGFYAVIP